MHKTDPALNTMLAESMRIEDARLIAAAPELLEALKRLLKLPEIKCIETFHHLGIVEVDDARAAIAKAEGKS